MENKLLVIYVGVAGIRSEDIRNFIEKITSKISPETFQGEIIVIPIQSPDTKIECINPKYITDVDLINEHKIIMNKLNYELQIQLELLKNKKDE